VSDAAGQEAYDSTEYDRQAIAISEAAGPPAPAQASYTTEQSLLYGYHV
jgi:hypothetical protein